MVCCRCNCSGRCQNCACVKRGLPCYSCLPKRLGNCVNIVWTQSSMAPASTASLPPPTMNSVPDTPPSPLPSPTSTARNISSVSTPSSQPLTLAANVPKTPPGDIVHTGGPDSLHDHEYNLILPQFAPMASPVFTWGACSSEPFIVCSILLMLKLCIGR